MSYSYVVALDPVDTFLERLEHAVHQLPEGEQRDEAVRHLDLTFQVAEDLEEIVPPTPEGGPRREVRVQYDRHLSNLGAALSVLVLVPPEPTNL